MKLVNKEDNSVAYWKGRVAYWEAKTLPLKRILNAGKKGRAAARKYGVPPETIVQLLNAQNFSCAICKRHRDDLKKDLAVDHCHKTNKIRGLLCQECNLGLGKFKDSPESLTRAVQYLTKEPQT